MYFDNELFSVDQFIVVKVYQIGLSSLNSPRQNKNSESSVFLNRTTLGENENNKNKREDCLLSREILLSGDCDFNYLHSLNPDYFRLPLNH